MMSIPYRSVGYSAGERSIVGSAAPPRRFAGTAPSRRFAWNVLRRWFAHSTAVLLCILFCASLFGLVSCRSKSAGELSLGEAADTTSISPGVYMTASIISDRGEIEKLFNTFPPDSGIVPLEVTIRNGTERPVLIHTAHGLDAPEPFHGFTLEAGTEEYAPLSPFDALAILMGVGEAPRYRKPGIFDAVVGIAVPPAILYYGHREVSVGRHYRSIFKHSIYEATKSGVVEPILLEAGEETNGFLFFYLPPDANPYHIGEEGANCVDSVRAAGHRLTLRPSDIQAYDTLRGTEGWTDAAVAYLTDKATGVPSERGERDGILFALPTGGKWRGEGILAGRTREILQQGGSAMMGISKGISSKASIAGTAALGGHAACAVNFKATSRIYIVDISGPPTLIEEIEFDRKIRRVFLVVDGLIVATNDNRCRYISLDGMKLRRNVKLSRHVRDIFLDGDRLFVLGEKELSIFTTVMPDPLRLIERRPVGKADRRFVGGEDGLLYFVHESGKARRDTLAAYERGSLEELARMVLPASAWFVDAGDKDLLLQLDGGTVLSIGFDAESHRFEVECAGYVPFEAALVERGGSGFTVLGKDGTLARGDILPPMVREFVTIVPVGVKPPEITPSRSRARH